MEWNYSFLFMDPLPDLLTSFSLSTLSTEEITGCSIEATKVAYKAPRNLRFCFFVACFTVSVPPSLNTPKSSNDFMILTLLFISSFKKKKKKNHKK